MYYRQVLDSDFEKLSAAFVTDKDLGKDSANEHAIFGNTLFLG